MKEQRVRVKLKQCMRVGVMVRVRGFLGVRVRVIGFLGVRVRVRGFLGVRVRVRGFLGVSVRVRGFLIGFMISSGQWWISAFNLRIRTRQFLRWIQWLLYFWRQR